MTSNPLLLSVGAGLVSAVTFVSVALGHPGIGVLLFVIIPLPILLSGLGLGWKAALVAAAVASTVVLLIGGPQVGAAFAAGHMAPAVILSRLALLNRPGTDPQSLEWYPPGRLVVAAALLGAALALALVGSLGGSDEAMKAQVGPHMESMLKAQIAAAPGAIDEADVPKLVDVLIKLIPAMTAVTATAALIFNLWLAGRVTLASGQLQRPWPDLGYVRFPGTTALAFAAGMAASFLDGWPGYAGKALSGALLLAYMLAGLAVIHTVTRGAGWRPFALWALYLALLFINPTFLVVAAVGLLDTIWPLRREPPS